MSVRGGAVRLREIADDDVPQLLIWRNSAAFSEMCTFRTDNVCLDAFREELAADFEYDRLCQFVIEVERGNENVPAGTIFAYGLNESDGYCFFTTFVSEAHTSRGYGIYAAALMIDYLFVTHGLFKVYMDVYEHNHASIAAMRRFGCHEEGRFRKQRLIAGARYDVLRLALYADDLELVRQFLKRRGYVLRAQDVGEAAPSTV
jgi:RimJ/RimL family protein N-acetyltransferase